MDVRSLTDEHLRILLAIREGRLGVNASGRYVIDGEERPDRKSREQLRSRGLIAHFWSSERRRSEWRVTAKGNAALKRAMASRVAARSKAVKQLQAEGMSFADAYMAATKV